MIFKDDLDEVGLQSTSWSSRPEIDDAHRTELNHPGAYYTRSEKQNACSTSSQMQRESWRPKTLLATSRTLSFQIISPPLDGNNEVRDGATSKAEAQMHHIFLQRPSRAWGLHPGIIISKHITKCIDMQRK